MLSAEEIISESNKPSTLPQHGGLKYFERKDTSEESESVQHAVSEYYGSLKEERICRKMNLSVGEWQPEYQHVLITTIKGGTIQKFGYQTRTGKYLFPEEALFLIEQGILEVTYDEIPLSFQEAHSLFIPVIPYCHGFEYYQIYAHLCRQGFVVSRYQKSNSSETTQHRWDKVSEEITDTKLSPSKKENEQLPDSLVGGYMKSLWKGTVKPLVRPEDAKNTASILSKLKVGKLVQLKDHDSDVDDESELKIAFDVYESIKSKKKTKQPQFRVVVCRFSDPPPSVKDMARLTRDAEEIHLKIGLVNQGTVTFYGIFSTDLPTIITQI